MKLLKKLFLACLVVSIVSCDALTTFTNKGKVKDAAREFVQAISEKDKVAIYELYPDSRNFNSLSLPEELVIDGVSVEFNEEDSSYVATLNEKQSLIFRVEDDENVKIYDSRNVMKLDSAAYELAAATGVPVKKMTDMKLGELFSDDSSFMLYMINLYSSAVDGYLYHSNGRYNWRGGSYPTVQFDLPVTNGGDKEVKGEDYTVEVIYTRRDNGERIGTSVELGQDLAPGETHVFCIYKNELYYAAKTPGLYCTVSFLFKNASNATMLSRYGSFSGEEYADFLKYQEELEKEAAEYAEEVEEVADEECEGDI